MAGKEKPAPKPTLEALMAKLEADKKIDPGFDFRYVVVHFKTSVADRADAYMVVSQFWVTEKAGVFLCYWPVGGQSAIGRHPQPYTEEDIENNRVEQCELQSAPIYPRDYFAGQ